MSSLIKILLLFIVGIGESISLPAQAPFFKTVVYDKEKKGAKLIKVFQDKNGLIWLGTNMGVCRYDGVSFRYLEKDSTQVSCIGQSNDSVLWMGHVNGRLEYKDELTVKKFTTKERMPSAKITDILFDKQNRMWVSTYGEGIYCYYNSVLYNISSKDGLSDDVVYDLLLNDDNTVWAATDMGISICSFINGKRKIQKINDQNGLPDNIVRSLKKDETGNTWIALQDKGVCYAEAITGRIVVPEETAGWQYGQVNDVLPMNKEVFIATEENGIIEIHSGLPQLNKMAAAKNKKFNSVQQLMLDRNEQVWVVSDNVLSITNSNRFQTIEIPEPWQDQIKAMTSDAAGTTWFANKKGIFNKQNENSAIEQVPLKKIDFSSVVCLYADDKNNIWIGTYNNGLYRYNPLSKSLKQYTRTNGLVDDNIFSISGNSNEIWLGTLGGATRIYISNDTPLFENFTKENGLNNNFVYNISIDAGNNKWFATDGSGLTKYDNTGFKHYAVIPGLEKNIAYTTVSDIYDNIWFTGLNSGLFCFDGLKFKRYTIKNGMNDNEILNVIPDKKGNLLLSHPDGIEIFDIKKESFTFYGAESGFDNIRPQLNAYCKGRNNSILLGSSEKIIQYYPADSNYDQLPQLVMNDVQLFFKSIGTAKGKIFGHEENHLSFDYAGLWYINPEAISYEYELEGYNKSWISTRDHIITFPQLPPGTYTFRVKTSINGDFRYSPELTYQFTIAKPFWRKAWFIIAALLGAALLIYYLVRLRIRVLNYQQEKANQNLMAELALLRNQLNPHFLFNSFNTLMNIIDKDKNMAMEYTEKLSDFYREILLMQDKEMVTVEEELKLLQNYIYLQQKRFGSNLQLHLNVTSDQLRSGIPPLTLQLLAENALKHNKVSSTTPLTIKIDSAQSFLVVSNNINRQEANAKSTGIGLKNIQQRVQLLTGKEVKLVITETEFNIIIPLKTNITI